MAFLVISQVGHECGGAQAVRGPTLFALGRRTYPAPRLPPQAPPSWSQWTGRTAETPSELSGPVLGGAPAAPAALAQAPTAALACRPTPHRFLTVQRPNGRRVVVVTDEEQLRPVRSGQPVRVSGRWLTHPGRNGTQGDENDGVEEPVTVGGVGCGRSKRCMRAGSIIRTSDWQQWQPVDDSAGEACQQTRQGARVSACIHPSGRT